MYFSKYVKIYTCCLALFGFSAGSSIAQEHTPNTLPPQPGEPATDCRPPEYHYAHRTG